MKSRVKKENLSLIGYMIEKYKADSLAEIAEKMNAQLKLYGKDAAGEKIGYLAEFSGFEKQNIVPPDIPEDECLIISGFNNKNMDKLLYEMKLKNIILPLKCVVTQHNQSWILGDLIQELKKEHKNLNKE